MAKQKTQLRLVVKIDGKLRRLLSIREGSKGDLFITTHVNNLFDSPDLKVPIKENRHALHVSAASDLTTVHGVIRRQDGSSLDKHLVTSAVREGRYQPIYVRQVIHPDVLPELSLPAKGPVVGLPTYNPARCTMYHAVWFSATDVLFPSAILPFQMFGYRFKQFMIYVPYCYLPTPSLNFGRTFDYTTTSADQQTPEHIAMNAKIGPSQGATAYEAAGHIINDFNRMIEKRGWLNGLEIGKFVKGPIIPRFLNHPIL